MRSIIDAILYYFSGEYLDHELAIYMKKREAYTEEQKEYARQEFIRRKLQGRYL